MWKAFTVLPQTPSGKVTRDAPRVSCTFFSLRLPPLQLTSTERVTARSAVLARALSVAPARCTSEPVPPPPRQSAQLPQQRPASPQPTGSSKATSALEPSPRRSSGGRAAQVLTAHARNNPLCYACNHFATTQKWVVTKLSQNGPQRSLTSKRPVWLQGSCRCCTESLLAPKMVADHFQSGQLFGCKVCPSAPVASHTETTPSSART